MRAIQEKREALARIETQQRLRIPTARQTRQARNRAEGRGGLEQAVVALLGIALVLVSPLMFVWATVGLSGESVTEAIWVWSIVSGIPLVAGVLLVRASLRMGRQ